MSRFFWALVPDQTSLSELSLVTNELKGAGINIRWEPGEKLHATLLFLGKISSTDIEQIKAKAQKLILPAMLEANYTGLGIFQHGNTGSGVIWAGFSATQQVQELYTQILSIHPQIKSSSRSFVPHITLSRVKYGIDSISRIVHSAESGNFILKFQSVVLFSSILSPQGSEYHPELVLRFSK